MNLAAISRPSGALAMVAMDQRESLRQMFELALGPNLPGSTLVDFKVAVAEELSPYASAMLLDTHFGMQAMARLQCPLIVAADALEYGQPGVVSDTRFDRAPLRGTNAVAAKLLVVWRRDAQRGRRVAMTREFVRAAHAAKLLAIVEGVVRRDDDSQAERPSCPTLPEPPRWKLRLFGEPHRRRPERSQEGAPHLPHVP